MIIFSSTQFYSQLTENYLKQMLTLQFLKMTVRKSPSNFDLPLRVWREEYIFREKKGGGGLIFACYKSYKLTEASGPINLDHHLSVTSGKLFYFS